MKKMARQFTHRSPLKARHAENHFRRVNTYNTAARKKLDPDEIIAFPQYRDHLAVARKLEDKHLLEFMGVCRNILPPTKVKYYDQEKAFPPSYRSMRVLLITPSLIDLLSQAVDLFGREYFDLYKDVLRELYGRLSEK